MNAAKNENYHFPFQYFFSSAEIYFSIYFFDQGLPHGATGTGIFVPIQQVCLRGGAR
jgi:hypothetical protein